MFDRLDIYDPRERLLVGLADAGLAVTAWPLRILRRGRAHAPGRILLLRLERMGDLLMTLGAIRAVRSLAPHAVVDLVVGSWNEPLAQAIGGLDRVQVLDAPWLARGGEASSTWQFARRSLRWQRQHYDLALNFEPDIRSHLLMAGSLARRRVGFPSAGGGSLLTDAVPYDPARHVALNALALVEAAFDVTPGSLPRPTEPHGRDASRLTVPAAVRDAARDRLAAIGIDPATATVVAVHAPGGRPIKQWPPERFAEVAARLARDLDAHVLLTGAGADRAIVEEVRHRLPRGVRAHVLAGAVDVMTLAGLLAECAVLVTGDTGPMHLAAAVDTPVVGVFGPSTPVRYAPLSPRSRTVRIDLPCSPCNRIRRPPARCIGHTPDCLAGIGTDAVVAAVHDLLGTGAALRAHAT